MCSQQSTTHPIESDIVDTDATFLSFDGLTYGKGASVLKQLVARLGLDNFKSGSICYSAAIYTMLTCDAVRVLVCNAKFK